MNPKKYDKYRSYYTCIASVFAAGVEDGSGPFLSLSETPSNRVLYHSCAIFVAFNPSSKTLFLCEVPQV